ncbi:MAG TPA: alpha/beta fold hydrolase [Candidatus Limnocylindrales bacterium]
MLAYTRRGTGTPLVLLHGIGASHRAWAPVMPALAERFDVIAVDLPGFGGSDPVPPKIEPTPAVLAASVASFLDELGISTPHVAGNSLGGWVALELAALRPVASLALLSPAGLWRDRTPVYTRVSLRIMRWLARHCSRPLSPLLTYRLARIVVLGQVHGRPTRVDPDHARTEIRDLGTCPGFEATMKAAQIRHYRAESSLDTRVTVAFGSRDLVLLAHQSRHLEQLPPGTRVESLPRCGHVPMPDDPDAVAAFIAVATTGHVTRHDIRA